MPHLRTTLICLPYLRLPRLPDIVRLQANKFFNRYLEDASMAQTPEAKENTKLLKKKNQARTNLRSMAIQVASFFYSPEETSESWFEKAEALTEDKAREEKERKKKEQTTLQDTGALNPRKEQERDLNESIFRRAVDPLDLPEVPQFVRDVINAVYPSLVDEVQLRMISVPEMDVLFREAADPLYYLTGVVNDITLAKGQMLEACAFDLSTGARNTKLRAFNVPDAFKRLHKALKIKAGTQETRQGDSPTWAPPRLRSATTDNGKATYRELNFIRFKLDTHADILTAVEAVETFWKMTLMLYKAMSMQRKYVLFLSACAKTDAARYAKMLQARFDDEESRQTAQEALKNNVTNIKKMLKATKDVLVGCQKDIQAMQSYLKEWRKEWRLEEVKRAPTTVNEIIPFLLKLTRTEWADEKRGRAKNALLSLVYNMYHPDS
jgi:hypothetical protein